MGRPALGRQRLQAHARGAAGERAHGQACGGGVLPLAWPRVARRVEVPVPVSACRSLPAPSVWEVRGEFGAQVGAPGPGHAT
eukprot:4333082-Alexandrium_andersonii.AAC.1